MSFINPVELGRSTIGNLKNNTWDVHPFMKIYEDDAKALVAYVESLKDKIKKYEEKENEDGGIYQEQNSKENEDRGNSQALEG